MALWVKASLCVKSSLLKQSLPRTPSRLTTNQRQSAKSAFKIRVNPWLINDLRLFKALYNCRETFTDVMSPLQIRLFMQNKANFRKSQMNVNNVLTKDYDKMDTWSSGKTKPIKANSKPIKANPKPIKANKMPKQTQFKPNLSRRSLWRRRNKAKFKKAKMNVTSILTVAYENKTPIRAPKKQSQISKRQKPMQTSLPQGIMKETRFWVRTKQTQTNPTCRGVASGEDGFKPNLSRRSLWRSRKQTQFQTNLGLLKLVSTSRMIKSYLNIVGSPCVIAGKTRLTIRKETFSISHAKTGNRVRFRN
jgi:hypothetical protein